MVADYLQERGFIKTLECFTDESKTIDGSNQKSGDGATQHGLPPLEALVENWKMEQLAKTMAKTQIEDTSPLDIPLSKEWKAQADSKLDLIHATNILTVSRHLCPRLHFDTSSASYRKYKVDCVVSTGADRTVKLTDFSTKEVIDVFSKSLISDFHDSPILAHQFHPACPRILMTGAMDGQCILTDVITRSVLLRFHDHQKFVVRLATSKDGQWLATASYDKSVNLYQLQGSIVDDGELEVKINYQKVHTVKYKTNPETLLFLPNDLLLVTCRGDNYLRYLHLRSREEEYSNINEMGDNHVSFSVLDSSLHPTGKFIALQTDSSIARIIIIATPGSATGEAAIPEISKHLRTFYIGAAQDNYTTPRHAWCPIPQKKSQSSASAVLACAGDDGLIRIVDVEKGKVVQKIPTHQAVVRAIWSGLDNDQPVIMSGSFDRTVAITKLVL